MLGICNVGFVDSSSVSCAGLHSVFGHNPFVIAGIWDSIETILQDKAKLAPHTALMINNRRMPLPGADIVKRLHQEFPDIFLVLFGESDSTDRVKLAMEAKFDGYILETVNVAALAKAVELVVLGERFFPARTFAVRTDEVRLETGEIPNRLNQLSPQELRVASLIGYAYPNKVIAREMGIAESTVKVHVKSIFRKTGMRNRTDVALVARDLPSRFDQDLIMSMSQTVSRPSAIAFEEPQRLN